jgi:hypothetical protein
MSVLRREFFAILGICATNAEDLFAQHDTHTAEAGLDFAAYRPRTFSPSEYELLDAFAETLLPADETGPGAHAAHVAYYLDVVLTHAPAARQLSWKNGLAHIEALVDERFHERLAACSDLQRQEIMAAVAKNEMTPQTDADRFFVELKRTVIDGFYASELIRREHLGYKGNTAVPEFAGCTHANFEHPDSA